MLILTLLRMDCMDIMIDRAGNVYYKGNPATINLTRNNKGNLIKE